MMFVLDCSVTMAWLFEDEKTTYTEAILKQLTHQAKAIVPSLWYLEVNNVLLVSEKRHRITIAQTEYFWTVLRQLPISVHAHPIEQNTESILHLARQHQLSSYDANYLNLAITLNLPLASLDKVLLKAAKSIGVSLYS